MNTIVMLSGKQGSGKTTLSQELIRIGPKIGYHFSGTIKFADPLYDLHDTILNKMENYTGKPRVKKNGPVLQWLGTEFGRNNYGENVWCDILRHRIETNQFGIWEKGKKYNPKELPDNLNRLIVIDDCRFRNEFDAFPEALRVRLVCDESKRQIRTDSWRDNTSHPSEVDLDGYEADGKFDLYLDTENVSPVDCGSLIAAQLQKNSWIEKRK
jgi:hypothetical protein